VVDSEVEPEAELDSDETPPPLLDVGLGVEEQTKWVELNGLEVVVTPLLLPVGVPEEVEVVLVEFPYGGVKVGKLEVELDKVSLVLVLDVIVDDSELEVLLDVVDVLDSDVEDPDVLVVEFE